MNHTKNEKIPPLTLLIVLLFVAAIINVEQVAHLLETHTDKEERLIKDLQKSLKKYLKVKEVRVRYLPKVFSRNGADIEVLILAGLKINDKPTKTYIITGEYEKPLKLTIQDVQRFRRSKSNYCNNFRVKKK